MSRAETRASEDEALILLLLGEERKLGFGPTLAASGLHKPTLARYKRGMWQQLAGENRTRIVDFLKVRQVLPEDWTVGQPLPDAALARVGEVVEARKRSIKRAGRVSGKRLKVIPDAALSGDHADPDPSLDAADHVRYILSLGVVENEIGREEVAKTARAIARGMGGAGQRELEEFAEAIERGE